MDISDAGLRFPVSFDLKVIMEKGGDSVDTRTILEKILVRNEIPASDWDVKTKPESRYVRYSVSVTLQTRDRMDSLYRDLAEEPRVRSAI